MISNIFNTKANRLLIYLALLMLLDYIISFIGIHFYQCILEANPCMHYIMQLPFIYGIILRIFYILLPISLLRFYYLHANNKKYYFNVVHSLILVQIFPFSIHIIWIIKYYMGN